MRARLKVLDDLRVASPCPADWAEMSGTEQVRFCGQCQKHVYDLTVMSPEEVVEVIEATEGKFCGRLYQRQDGRVRTDDCPVGLARVLQKARRRGYQAAALAVGLMASAAALLLHGDRQSPKVFGPRHPGHPGHRGHRGPHPARAPGAAPPLMGDIVTEPPPRLQGKIAVDPDAR